MMISFGMFSTGITITMTATGTIHIHTTMIRGITIHGIMIPGTMIAGTTHTMQRFITIMVLLILISMFRTTGSQVTDQTVSSMPVDGTVT